MTPAFDYMDGMHAPQLVPIQARHARCQKFLVLTYQATVSGPGTNVMGFSPDSSRLVDIVGDYFDRVGNHGGVGEYLICWAAAWSLRRQLSIPVCPHRTPEELLKGSYYDRYR